MASAQRGRSQAYAFAAAGYGLFAKRVEVVDKYFRLETAAYGCECPIS